MPDDEGLREELDGALPPSVYLSGVDAVLDALLPVVERYAARRAAEALRPIHELFAGGPDTSCRTSWADEGAGGQIECVEVPIGDLRRALDGDGTEPRPAHRRMEDATGYADWLERHDSRFRRQDDADGKR